MFIKIIIITFSGIFNFGANTMDLAIEKISTSSYYNLNTKYYIKIKID